MIRSASNAYQTDSGHNKTLVTILGPTEWKKQSWLAIRHQRLELVTLAAQIRDAKISEELARAATILLSLEDQLIPPGPIDLDSEDPNRDQRERVAASIPNRWR